MSDVSDDPPIITARTDNSLTVPWPSQSNPAGFLCFHSSDDWIAFVTERGLHPLIPDVVARKFSRAQKLYFLSWIDFDLMKAGELVALSALETALRDRYGAFIKTTRGPPTLQPLLDYMVEQDGLSNDNIPFATLYGGHVVEGLYESPTAAKSRKAAGQCKPITLASIRNGLAHGDPFDGLPWGGLLELVRDLIEYAYRFYLEEAEINNVGR